MTFKQDDDYVKFHWNDVVIIISIFPIIFGTVIHPVFFMFGVFGAIFGLRMNMKLGGK